MAAFESRVVVLGLRIAQAVLAVIILGLSAYGLFFPVPQPSLPIPSHPPGPSQHPGYGTSIPPDTNTSTVANWWSGHWHVGSPSEVNFLLFCAVWSLLALLYLILVPWRFSDTMAHHKFAILAAESVTTLFWFAGFIALAVFLTGRVCFGSVCSAAKAATVFGAFEWYVGMRFVSAIAEMA